MTKRYRFIDWIRGFAVINMIAYHAVWDVCELAPISLIPDLSFLQSPGIYVWQLLIGFTFIFLAGFCYCMSLRPLLKGLQLIAWGEVISIVTFFAVPNNPVRFGVLTLIGFGMIFLTLLHAWSSRLTSKWAAALIGINILLYILLHDVQTGYIWSVKIPSTLYRNTFTALLGFPPQGFTASDFYPFIPYLFVMIGGYMSYRVFEAATTTNIAPLGFAKVSHNDSHELQHRISKFIEWIGRHSLVIYLLHQVILFILISGIFWLISQ